LEIRSRTFQRRMWFNLGWEYAQLYGLCGIWEIIIFNKLKTLHFCRLSYGHPLDPYVVLSPTRGAAGGDRFWAQLFRDGI
jgi:hypothetical protein